MDIGANIKTHRKARGLTLTQLESLTGIDNGNLSKIERGIQSLTNESMTKISSALGISLEELFADASRASDNLDVRIVPKQFGGKSRTHKVTDFPSLKDIPPGATVAIDSIKVEPRSGVDSLRAGWTLDPIEGAIFLAESVRDLKSRPVDLASHRIRDETMQPRLYAGDHVIIDTSDKDIPDTGGVFAMIIDTRSVSVRRVFFQPGGGLLILCDNATYPRMMLSAEEVKSVVIIGRIKAMRSTVGF